MFFCVTYVKKNRNVTAIVYVKQSILTLRSQLRCRFFCYKKMTVLIVFEIDDKYVKQNKKETASFLFCLTFLSSIFIFGNNLD